MEGYVCYEWTAVFLGKTASQRAWVGKKPHTWSLLIDCQSLTSTGTAVCSLAVGQTVWHCQITHIDHPFPDRPTFFVGKLEDRLSFFPDLISAYGVGWPGCKLSISITILFLQTKYLTAGSWPPWSFIFVKVKMTLRYWEDNFLVP